MLCGFLDQNTWNTIPVSEQKNDTVELNTKQANKTDQTKISRIGG
jgi:hypothetical protein